MFIIANLFMKYTSNHMLYGNTVLTEWRPEFEIFFKTVNKFFDDFLHINQNKFMKQIYHRIA